MYIPTLRELLDKFRLPLCLSFSVTTSDKYIEDLLYDKCFHGVLCKSKIENLRKKKMSDYYYIFSVRYPEYIEYDIEGSVMIEWLNIEKIDTIDYNVNLAFYKYSKELENPLNKIGS